jgi:zinc transporter
VTRTLKPIAAYDILPDRSVRGVEEDWPDARPAADAAWRWLHFERTDPGFSAWSSAQLPAPVRAGLMQAETRPHCEVIGDGVLVTLHGMNLNPGQNEEDMVSLRVWIAANLVVTTRLRRVFPLNDLRAELAGSAAAASSGAFATRLADLLTSRIEAASAVREDRTDAAEEEILDDRPEALGPQAVDIARIARSVIKMRRHIAPQRDALHRFAAAEVPFLKGAERHELRSAANRTARAGEELDTVRDRLFALRSHVDSLQTAHLSRSSFVLSVAAAVFLPLSFLTGLFGMNVAGMPGTTWPWAFAALTAGMRLT